MFYMKILFFIAILLTPFAEAFAEKRYYINISENQKKYDPLKSIYFDLDKVIIWPTSRSYQQIDKKLSLKEFNLDQIAKDLLEQHIDVPIEIVKDRKTHLFDWPEFSHNKTLFLWVNLSLNKDILSIETRLFRHDMKNPEESQSHCFESYLIPEKENDKNLKVNLIQSLQKCLKLKYYKNKKPKTSLILLLIQNF